jgi:hypothetical protein
MRDGLRRFQEVDRILREKEQLHRLVGCLQVQNTRLSEELRTAALQLEWIATFVRERPRHSRE